MVVLRLAVLVTALAVLQPVREASAEPPADASASPDAAAVREYRIRLDAHRRELLRREQDLHEAERRIGELVRRLQERRPAADRARAEKDLSAVARERDEARAEARRLSARSAELETELRSLPAPSPPTAAPPASAPAAMPAALAPTPSAEESETIAALRHDLDVERENRKTLEDELRRVLADRVPEDQQRQTSRALESAKAELLLLHGRLAEEERQREALEVLVARARSAAAVDAAPDWIDRFELTMRERQQQAERLREELRAASEAIVALKARIEASPPNPAASPAAREALERENASLRRALQAAEQANADLKAQAELAARLADMLAR